MKHVEWCEVRSDVTGREVFLVIAELTAKGWQFYERSTWEVRWYPLPASPERVAKAEGIGRGFLPRS
jgi:hypothetical protein